MSLFTDWVSYLPRFFALWLEASGERRVLFSSFVALVWHYMSTNDFWISKTVNVAFTEMAMAVVFSLLVASESMLLGSLMCVACFILMWQLRLA